jgi:putative transposase
MARKRLHKEIVASCAPVASLSPVSLGTGDKGEGTGDTPETLMAASTATLRAITGSGDNLAPCRLLSTEEAAEFATTSIRTIQRHIASGRLQAEVVEAQGYRAKKPTYRLTEEALATVFPEAQARIDERKRYLARLAELAAPPAPAIAPALDPAAIPAMKDWQRQRMDARLAFLRHLDDQVAGGITRERAINRLLGDAEAGRLPETLQALLPLANARSGQSGDRTLSRRTVQRWAADAKLGMDHLAPKGCDRAMPSWLPQLLNIYRQPQEPSLSWAVQTLVGQLPEGATAPSYDSARRWLIKVGAVERERGRMLPRELKTIKPFRRREKPEFPFDVLTADGHTFDAEIAHPEHGRPFRPELTMVVDVATNRIVGWSAWEKESTWSVMDAFRMAVLRGGVPLIFYTDNGPGYRNDRMEALKSRLGYDHQFSVPYNSQARGVIEHMQKTVWVDMAAKAFSTYVGASMDREARQIVFKASRKGLPVLPSWQNFVAFVDQVVAAHNARASKACPKALDVETGRQRRLSPNQTWSQAEALGWKPEGLPLTLDDFRPEELRMARRGEISLFGNTYFNNALAELHGEMVRVAFDIHDATRVWVRREDGTFVCEAAFEANKSAYFPRSYVDSLREKRKEGQRQRLEAKAQRVLGEPLEQVEVEELTDSQRALAAEAFSRLPGFQADVEAAPVLETLTPSGRPAFRDDLDYLRWAIAHPDALDSQEDREIQHRIQADPALQAVLGLGA